MMVSLKMQTSSEKASNSAIEPLGVIFNGTIDAEFNRFLSFQIISVKISAFNVIAAVEFAKNIIFRKNTYFYADANSSKFLFSPFSELLYTYKNRL